MVHLAKRYYELWLRLMRTLLLEGVSCQGVSSGGGVGHAAAGLQTSKSDSSVSSSRVPHTAAPAIPLQPEVLGGLVRSFPFAGLNVGSCFTAGAKMPRQYHRGNSNFAPSLSSASS